MPSFFLAEIEILDFEKYTAYIDRASQIVRSFGGEYVFRSDSVIPVSGNWTPQRMVLIRFDSKKDLHRCFGSESYLKIKHLREQSTRSRAVIIDQDTQAGTRVEEGWGA
jgi:uncharacterized protein (DUF1330 family)